MHFHTSLPVTWKTFGGRLCGIRRRPLRRARRPPQGVAVAVLDGLRPQPLAVGPVLREPEAGHRHALPHPGIRRLRRGAARGALRPHEVQGVAGRGKAGRVVYNPSLLVLLKHYGSAPRACRPYSAKTKGKVERPFRYIR